VDERHVEAVLAVARRLDGDGGDVGLAQVEVVRRRSAVVALGVGGRRVARPVVRRTAGERDGDAGNAA